MCLKIQRYELVEVLINTTGTGPVFLPSSVSNLQDNPERAIYITGIEIFPVYAQANSIKNPGVVGLPVTEIPKISLTVYYDRGEFIRYIPAAGLIYTVPPNNVDSPYTRERIPFNSLYPVMIDQCYLNFNTAPSGGPYVVPIGFTYIAVAKRNGV